MINGIDENVNYKNDKFASNKSTPSKRFIIFGSQQNDAKKDFILAFPRPSWQIRPLR